MGQRVLEHLADEPLGHKPSRRDDSTLVSMGRWRGEDVTLVKPLSFMNVCGPVIARALRRLGAEPDSLILVYDDIDLPLGAVRVRVKGGAGGHNGVRSVIDTLGTSDIRRVKVGVGRPEHKAQVPDHVLSVFEPDELPAVEAAVVEATTRVLNLVVTPISR